MRRGLTAVLLAAMLTVTPLTAHAADVDATITYDARTDTLTVQGDMPRIPDKVMPGDKLTGLVGVDAVNVTGGTRVSVQAEPLDERLPDVVSVSVGGDHASDNMLEESEPRVILDTDEDTSTTMDVTLDIPETVGNEVNGVTTGIRWTITATEEDGTGDTIVVDENGSVTGRDESNPSGPLGVTGASVLMAAFAALAVFAVGCALSAVRRRQRR